MPSEPGSSTGATCSWSPSWWGATPAFADGVRTELRLLDERRFRNGTVHLHYRTGS